jgi:16S rRNA (cytidine1402-2'-O)-methyltransferase
MTGRLILVATPLGNLSDVSARAIAVLGAVEAIACEDTRRTGLLLSRMGIEAPRLLAVHAHNEASMVQPVMDRLSAGGDVALVSDAGMPGISDPGARVVAAAIAAGIEVTVVPGPSAAISALAISGLPTDRWVFEGFLPRKGADRRARLTAIAGESRTALLYEAPHRLETTLRDLAAVCGGERAVVLVRELTKLHEEVWRGTLEGAIGLTVDRTPRGEYVVVLDGAPPAEVTDESISAALRATGSGTGAVAEVAAALGVPKRRVYNAALRLRGGR